MRGWLVGMLVSGITACGSVDAGMREVEASIPQDASAETGAVETNPLVPIRVGGIEIMVEIADEPAEHQRGLMFRESLEPNQGMLFVYSDERTLAFWMKNTLIPLDIAYADREGRIVDIQSMEPQTSETHPSAAPAMYALEMNQGWFEANGIQRGALIEF